MEPWVLGSLSNVGPGTSGEVVQDSDVVADGQQVVSEVAANETGASGDNSFHAVARSGDRAVSGDRCRPEMLWEAVFRRAGLIQRPSECVRSADGGMARRQT